MQKYKNIKDLLAGGNKRLSALKSQTRERSVVLGHVRSALPPKIAESIMSAGIEREQLIIGVSSAAWACRLRYSTELLRKRISQCTGIEIQSIRIKVITSHR